MILIKEKENCTGCTACKQVCPKNCITMAPDSEGFYYPIVDTSLCIDCHLCENVCPINSRRENSVISVYAAQNKDIETRKNSSSGGTFRLLCNKVLDAGGVVFGCAFDNNMVATHIAVEDKSDLIKLQSSKYVQSDVKDTYKEVLSLLENGRKVLFSGTPCQVAGLKNLLKKDYDNLLLIDVLCHGVPSPKFFEDYKNEMERKFGAKMTSLKLRDKKKSWKRLFVNAEFENGKKYFTFCGYDHYLSMFLNNISLRPSCFDCRFTTCERQGDISLGDFWGIGKHIKEMDDDKGTSLIITNTKKGEDAFNDICENLTFVKTDIETAIDGNKVLKTPSKKNQNRDEFYTTYAEQGYSKAVEKFSKVPSKPMQIYYTLLRKGLDFYRFIFKKTY